MPKSERRLSPCSIVELASGVDALYLSGQCTVPVPLWVYLADLKVRAVEEKRAVPAALDLCEFALQDHGFGKYPIRLEHPHGVIGVTDSEKLPALRFQPRAEFLHGESPEAAVTWFRRIFEPAVGELALGVSRLDLFVDWQGWVPEADDRQHFVTRARKRVLYEDIDELTGFQFGKRGSGPTARLYDKTEDVENKGTDYWYEMWGDARIVDEPVWRAEVEFSRKVLRDFRLDGPESVLPAIGGLWRYATEQWLTLRLPTGDETRSRWPIDGRWESLQNASFASRSIGLERAREAKVEASLEWWVPRLRGALIGCGALLGAADEDAVIAAIPNLLRVDEARSGTTFEDRLLYRRWLASMS